MRMDLYHKNGLIENGLFSVGLYTLRTYLGVRLSIIKVHLILKIRLKKKSTRLVKKKKLKVLLRV
jgi:hypothetical protein